MTPCCSPACADPARPPTRGSPPGVGFAAVAEASQNVRRLRGGDEVCDSVGVFPLGARTPYFRADVGTKSRWARTPPDARHGCRRAQRAAYPKPATAGLPLHPQPTRVRAVRRRAATTPGRACGVPQPETVGLGRAPCPGRSSTIDSAVRAWRKERAVRKSGVSGCGPTSELGLWHRVGDRCPYRGSAARITPSEASEPEADRGARARTSTASPT